MGLGLSFVEGEGPRFARPVRDPASIDRLAVPDMGSELAYVMDTVRLVRTELDGRVPLIGFAGSPWTLAAYMVEGGPPGTFQRVRRLMLDEPAAIHRLLGVITRATTEYLNAQVAAGAQALMLFDTWGGALSTHAFLRFSLPYMRDIIAGLVHEHDGRKIPVIVFTKGGGMWMSEICGSGCDALGLDWTVDLGTARRLVGHRAALQGNMDPCVLGASPAHIREEVARVLESYGEGSGHVFNLGHGILPDVDPEHVAVTVEAVHELSARRIGEEMRSDGPDDDSE
jgi:uroporphyrinogen decarboxylase